MPSASTEGVPSGIVAALDRLREVERPVQLRALRVGGLCARTPQLLLEPAQGALVALEQLDLELAEPSRHALALDHGDVVVDDLGALRAHALAAGAQAGDGHELGSAQVRGHEREHLGGGVSGWAGQLELDPCRAARQFQLPQPGAVLDAVPEGDAVAREPQVSRVVVGGDEHPRRQPLSSQLGQHEPFPGSKLDFAFERLAHLSQRTHGCRSRMSRIG